MPCLGQINDTHHTGPSYDRGLCLIFGASLWRLVVCVKAVMRECVWSVGNLIQSQSEGKLRHVLKKTFIHDKLLDSSWLHQKVEGPGAMTKEREQ